MPSMAVTPTGQFLNDLIYSTCLLVHIYYWILTLRLSMQWFPNLNPYITPFYILIFMTDFFLEMFDDILPDILGMNMSAMLAFTFLEYLIQTLDSIHFL
ncbi:unnamed protein product [Choristocarpus tenellus]|uniref:hypothetical protein n=1 Tax=Choristocarpus tenellus TaxID=116065 RepID=UPI002E78F0A2|nr:hypothetical protein V2478_pgp118 [Choristocarpus tenellus]WAM62297.1 hypothetical protein [Choristocarpus tenellus]